MTSARPTPGNIATMMRTEMLFSGRLIYPYPGPEVIWNGLNGKSSLDQGNVSVS